MTQLYDKMITFCVLVSGGGGGTDLTVMLFHKLLISKRSFIQLSRRRKRNVR